MTILFAEEQNLSQIRALKNARFKTIHNINLMNKRVAMCKRQTESLRRFGSLKSGNVQEYVFNLANSLELRLYECLRG